MYDIVLCVYESFRVDGWKRYVNDVRLRVDGGKNTRLLAFAFTTVFVWTGPQCRKFIQRHYFCCSGLKNFHVWSDVNQRDYCRQLLDESSNFFFAVCELQHTQLHLTPFCISQVQLQPFPRANPWEFSFFFLRMAISRGRGHLICQMPGGGYESKGQMPRPKNTTKFVAWCEMRKCFLTEPLLTARVNNNNNMTFIAPMLEFRALYSYVNRKNTIKND